MVKRLKASSVKSFREQLFAYVKEKYKTSPEYLWPRGIPKDLSEALK